MENVLNYQDAMDFVNSLKSSAILDRDGRYTYVSPDWCKGTGVSAEEAIGRRVDDIFPDTHALDTYRTKDIVYSMPVTIPSTKNLAFTTYFPKIGPDGEVEKVFLYVNVNGYGEIQSLQNQFNEVNQQVAYYKKKLANARGAKYSLDNIVGESIAIKRVKEQIKQAARSASTVLIQGETGSGKELVAHSIHALSPRYEENFVKVNCSAIPENLMESEFFGYAAGAFTGAVKGGKTGRFKMADKGSIFLDEINLLPYNTQPKFLRVLQEHEIDPVGAAKSEPIDVRVIAASNIPLETLVRQNTFRVDLFYRLNVIKIIVPPLRERKEDIPLIAESILQQLNIELGTFIQGIEPSAMKMLENYNWPGNARELHNAIESAINMSSGSTLKKSDFRFMSENAKNSPSIIPIADGDYNLKILKSNYEKELVRKVMEEAEGNKQKAARMLGISRPVLYEKLKQYDL